MPAGGIRQLGDYDVQRARPFCIGSRRAAAQRFTLLGFLVQGTGRHCSRMHDSAGVTVNSSQDWPVLSQIVTCDPNETGGA